MRIVDIPDVDDLMEEEGLNVNDNEGRRIREIIIESLEFRDGPKMEPVDELEEVVINPDYPEQKIKLGGHLSPEEKEEIISLLKNSLNVFAWRVEDVRGINEEVALHRLEVDPLAKTISQTRRNFARDKEDAIKEEVQKLLSAGIIREVKYPVWLANVVMVKKKNGKLRHRLHRS